jgi:FdhE protein
MRQGEITATGKWTGPVGAGVTSPIPLILPNAQRRFAATATRLTAVAVDHPAESWLRFMAQVAWGQHEAVQAQASTTPLRSSCIEQAIESGVAPLGNDGCPLDRSWQRSLASILDYLQDRALPGEARAIMVELRDLDDDELDKLAYRFLRDSLPKNRIGHAFYVASALQVHYTALAARLPVDSLRLLPERGLCPCCRSTPVTGVVTATGRSPGCRYLHCSLCSTAWNHVRAICVNCGGAGKLSLHCIEGQGLAKAETCDHCGTYSKLLYEQDTPSLDAVADDLSTLALDLMVGEAGWSRHAPNPLLLAL